MRFSDTNYNLYKVFVSVYEHRNLTRAAKELFIGQPNVTRSIKELERNLEVKLFYSHPRGVEPTSEGTALYKFVSPALAWIDQGEKNITELNERSIGTIRIAIVTNFAGYFLTDAIIEFGKKYPNVQFDILRKTAGDALELLEKHRIDFMLSTLPFSDKSEFERIELKEMTEIGIASTEFAEKNNLKEVMSEAEIIKLPYVAINMQDTIKRPTIVVDSQEALYQLIVKGAGVGFCLDEFIKCNHPNDKVLRFSVTGREPSKWSLHCVYDKECLSKTALAFLDALRQG